MLQHTSHRFLGTACWQCVSCGSKEVSMIARNLFLNRATAWPAYLERRGQRKAFSYCGTNFCFSGLSRPEMQALDGLWGAAPKVYLAQPEIPFQILGAAPGEFLDVETKGWEYGLHFEYEVDCVTIVGWRFSARIKLRGGNIEGVDVVSDWSEEVGGARCMFDNLFRIVLAYRLLLQGGVLLHSVAIVEDGATALLYGQSGDGKSTLARRALASGLDCMSDDLNAVLFQGDNSTFRVCGVPYSGELGRGPGPAQDLSGLFRLKQATNFSIDEMPATQARSSLVGAAPFVNADPFRIDRLWQNVSEMQARFPSRVAAVCLSEEPFHALFHQTRKIS